MLDGVVCVCANSPTRSEKLRTIGDIRVGVSPYQLSGQERRVRRLGRKYGVSLMKCEKPFGKVLQHGGYMLRDDDTRKIVFGHKGYEYSATLDEVEDFLLAQPKYRDDEED